MTNETTKPVVTQADWLCICGTWNAPEGKICQWCDAERVFSEARPASQAVVSQDLVPVANKDSALPSDRATAAEPEEVSALRDGIPSASELAALRIVSLQLSKDNGHTSVHSMSQHWGYWASEDEAVGAAIRMAGELKPGFSVDCSLVASPFAQGTEAQSAKTEGLGPKDDGPVVEDHAPDVQPLYPASAIEAAQIAARNEALDEAAKYADQHGSYDDALQRSAGCMTSGQRLAGIIRALRTPSHQEGE